MKIYRVDVDVTNYQSVGLQDESQYMTDMLDFDCYSKVNDWKSPGVYIMNPKQIRGNFMYLDPGVLVFDKIAFNALAEFFEMSGELLPLPCEEEEDLILINVMNCVNCLNKKKTEWRWAPTGERLTILKYSFHPQRIDEFPLFKIPETSRGEILTCSGLKNPDDEFITAYRNANLTGLLFDEIWSDETEAQDSKRPQLKLIKP